MQKQQTAGRLTGTRIRERRLALGVRQVDLAAQVEISPAYLNLIEHNKRRIGGKLLTGLARALQVEPGDLREGAEAAFLGIMNAAANRYPAANAEQDRTDEMAGRYPGWAGVLTAQHGRIRELERLVEALSDRMTHDPHLAAMLHEVLSSVTAIRSAVSILTEDGDIDPDWQARFLRNVAEDSTRLTASAQGLVGFLEVGSENDDAYISPQEAVTKFLTLHNWHFAGLEPEGDATAQNLVKDAPELHNLATRALALDWLQRYQNDAAALPHDAFAQTWCDTGNDPLQTAAIYNVAPSMVLRRLASIDAGGVAAGLVICDGSGALTTRKEISGFSVPRFGASCPRWPLFQALSQPARPFRTRVEMPGEHGRVFTCYAISDALYPAGIDGPAVHSSTMLIVPDPDATLEDTNAVDTALTIGPGCRVCPRAACPARREPSIMALER